MTRIDWIVLNRLGSRIGVTVLIFYGIITLAESLDTWRFNFVADNYGLPMAALMVAMSAVRWTIKTLPVTVLMGAILGFLDLKARHELTVIQSSGISMWRAVRAPTIALGLASLLIALGGETASTMINRGLYPSPPGQATLQTPAGEIWLEQRSGDFHYLMMATGMQPGGTLLGNVTIFRLNGGDDDRIEGAEALLEDGEWVLPRATIRNALQPARYVRDYRLPTTSSPAEISLKLSSTEDMTFFELADLLQKGVSDPAIRSAATMRLIKLLALPLVLTGSLFIAFAFTAGYRRSSNYGPAVLYGIVLGFVVFVITEMADRAGSTGVLDPTFAAVGPAFVAIVIGVTVLLHKEDGRA
ncbi:LptF/LptG family permease [Devosia sp. J2-20]|jgi:lipopolysaccharide export system permease protein|uniref:LptF/LptG family permease n=1 Tax=Devosia litorisediminis TaxID=2829817 RepID=A0A942EB07_9HYPH|nr:MULTISPECIES: LptF/LptG family permease [Devosia]MBS3848922.1 LptF/LptG family permease [Devosia litorisediminis]MCZ4346092.1 LptF/LptG family permease [Devosia neptuniae]WDQ97998.1 LptF/LptG family permease [Devosia sp. J2-20]|tara:strand:- start:2926 stop:3996 length:1071 start_codon:yes stop_codon:yes gene_type:complete